MALVDRVNLVTNPSFEYNGGLANWSATGGAAISQVIGFFTYRLRITWATTAAQAQSARATITGLTAGVDYRLWAYVPNRSGTTTAQLGAVGIGFGAAFATNDTLNKQGTYDFTATGTSHTIAIFNASAATAGDYTDVEYVITELKQAALTSTDYPYFDGDYAGCVWSAEPGNSISTFLQYDTTIASGAYPMLITEFDARPIGLGDFVLDRDSLDGPAALVSSPRWQVVPEVRSFTINRGRPSDDTDMTPGKHVIQIDDPTGKYDPDNPATPLQVDGVPVMRSGMAIRTTALVWFLGQLFNCTLFDGSLEDVSIDRGWNATATVYAVDDLAKLNTSSVPPLDTPSGEGASTFWRAVWALSFAGIGFFDPLYGDNMQRQMRATSGGGNVNSHLAQCANCEGGKVYVTREGKVKIATHVDDFTTAFAATFTDAATSNDDLEYFDIQTSTSIGKLINRSEIDRGDGVPKSIAQDDASVALNKRVWSETVDAPLYSDTEAAALAAWRASRRSKSATRVDAVSVHLAGKVNWWIKACVLDIASVIRVRRFTAGRGIDAAYSIEGMQWTFSRKGGLDLTVNTSPLDITGLYADQPQPFRLDTSSLDGPDILTAF